MTKAEYEKMVLHQFKSLQGAYNAIKPLEGLNTEYNTNIDKAMRALRNGMFGKPGGKNERS
jgi:hypothetical protein